MFFSVKEIERISPQTIRSVLSENITALFYQRNMGSVADQAQRLNERIKSGNPTVRDIRSVAMIRTLVFVKNKAQAADDLPEKNLTIGADFIIQASDELSIRAGERTFARHVSYTGDKKDKWLVDENLHGMEQVPGSYMGRGAFFHRDAARRDLADFNLKSRELLQVGLDRISALPPEEKAKEIHRLVEEYRDGLVQKIEYISSISPSVQDLHDFFDKALFERMAGINDREVLDLSIGRGCAVVVSKDRNPGQGDDGLCRLHLNRAVEIMNLMERIETNEYTSVYPYVLRTMPMIVLPIVPEVKGTLKLAENLVLEHAAEISRLAESKTVPLVKVTPEGGVEIFGDYRRLRNWQGEKSVAEYTDSEELIARLGHFANGDKFFRRSKFQHLAPVGQALGLVRV